MEKAGGSRPNFTRFQIKLLILLDTTHLCSHNISLNFILDVDVGSGFSPNQRINGDKSTLKHLRPILGNRSRELLSALGWIIESLESLTPSSGKVRSRTTDRRVRRKMRRAS